MRLLQKHKVLVGILSFLFMGLPQYIAAILSLIDRMQQVNRIPFNILWLYFVTIPIGLTMLALVFYQTYKDRHTENKEVLYAHKWEHYNKLAEHILALENAPKENIAAIMADIQRELVEIGDNQIDRLMSLFSDAVDEGDEFDLNPTRWEIRIILERTRERMNKKYPRPILKGANNE